jgi:hypothetical protein
VPLALSIFISTKRLSKQQLKAGNLTKDEFDRINRAQEA